MLWVQKKFQFLFVFCSGLYGTIGCFWAAVVEPIDVFQILFMQFCTFNFLEFLSSRLSLDNGIPAPQPIAFGYGF